MGFRCTLASIGEQGNSGGQAEPGWRRVPLMFDISVRIMVSMCRVDAVPMVVLYGRKRKFDRGMEEEGCGMRWESIAFDKQHCRLPTMDVPAL